MCYQNYYNSLNIILVYNLLWQGVDIWKECHYNFMNFLLMKIRICNGICVQVMLWNFQWKVTRKKSKLWAYVMLLWPISKTF